MSPKEVATSIELQSKSMLVIYATVRAIRFARKVMRCLTQGWIQWGRKQLEKKKNHPFILSNTWMKITHTAQTVATIALGRVFSMQLMYFRRIANSKEPKQKGQALSATSFTNYFCPAVKKKKKKPRLIFPARLIGQLNRLKCRWEQTRKWKCW